MSWYTALVTSWWILQLGTIWDSTTVIWDSVAVTWDSVDNGNSWYSSSSTSFATQNNTSWQSGNNTSWKA